MRRAYILIVEDEAIIVEDIRTRLVRMNYEVVGIADSGEKAVQLAEVLRPDLILMDVSLKGSIDGFEAGHLIEQLLGCPIIYVTSNALASQMRYSVPKPFTTAMLASTIARALAQSAERQL